MDEFIDNELEDLEPSDSTEPSKGGLTGFSSKPQFGGSNPMSKPSFGGLGKKPAMFTKPKNNPLTFNNKPKFGGGSSVPMMQLDEPSYVPSSMGGMDHQQNRFPEEPSQFESPDKFGRGDDFNNEATPQQPMATPNIPRHAPE